MHNLSDVFLEFGKLAKSSGIDYVPGIAFRLLAILWILLRIFYFSIVLMEFSFWFDKEVLQRSRLTPRLLTSARADTYLDNCV